MDNKLNELSKPVQIFKHPTGRNFWAVMADSTAGQNGVEPFYSQEYVSALLAELEAKDKRIAELEAKTAMTMGVGSGNGNLFVHGDYDSIKAAQAIVFENESLRAKLATPVRFPDCDIEAVSIMAHWLSDEEVNAWVKGVEFSKQRIRAAGFTVEGDE